MNALVPTTGNSMALVPQNMTEAMKLADLMSKAKLLPAAVQNPADAFLVINQAMRWGMDPFAVAQEVSVIQGKLMHSGKIVAAAVQSCGILMGRLTYDYSGAGDGRTVVVGGTLRGEAAPREITVVVKDVKTTNKVWQTQPDQQLAYSGARIWARRHAPEVMLGVYAPEEFDVTPERPAEPRYVQSETVKPDQPAGRFRDAVDDDSIPALDTPPADVPRQKADRMLARITACQDVDCLTDLVRDPDVEKGRAWLKANRPELDGEITAALSARHSALAAVEDPQDAAP